MRYEKQFEVGDKAEEVFMSLASTKGFKPYKSTLDEDMWNHIDVYLEKQGKFFTVDVKAMKKINRSDELSQDQFVFVEFKNVRGNPGWLYGQADFIAFETMNTFEIVSRAKLASYCEQEIKREYVSSPKEAFYKLYRRSGRKDLISLIELGNIPKQYVISWNK